MGGCEGGAEGSERVSGVGVGRGQRSAIRDEREIRVRSA